MQDILQVKQRFGIIGNAAALNYAIDVAVRVAPTNLSVLINGESGVGKESFSQVIHAYSPRKHNAFIAVNCGAIPAGTIDSELFGHEKGAFTGAHDKRKGYFETVNGGTIFLDEIGEMPLETQSRLLRVLESGEFFKVGSSQGQKTDVRVIAATNRNLIESVRNGKFREDLYYRLATVPIEVPPLRERGEDVLLLFRKFCSDFAERNRMQAVKLSDEANRLILNYSWPGNVRQLKNVAEQVSILTTNKTVSAEELIRYMPKIQQTNMPAVAGSSGDNMSMTEREILYKLIFELKRDMNDLKQFIYDLTGKEHIPAFMPATQGGITATHENVNAINVINANDQNKPIVLDENFHVPTRIEVEETLSLADKEREMINRALKKYRGRRKKAAQELGISERTLYRKIKEYKLEE